MNARLIQPYLALSSGNVLVNSDGTVDSLNSMPSIQALGHFRNVFVKPSEIFVFLVTLLPQRLTKKNFCINLLPNGFFLCLVTFKWLKKNYQNFHIPAHSLWLRRLYRLSFGTNCTNGDHHLLRKKRSCRSKKCISLGGLEDGMM